MRNRAEVTIGLETLSQLLNADAGSARHRTSLRTYVRFFPLWLADPDGEQQPRSVGGAPEALTSGNANLRPDSPSAPQFHSKQASPDQPTTPPMPT
jgi:hypothetical protein